MWNNYEEYNKYLASLKIKATRAGFKKYNSFMKKLNMFQIEYKYLLLNIKPVIIRVYYISVKNTEENLRFHHLWVNKWLLQREATLNYLLQNNNNLEVIPSLPEPGILPGLPSSWQISTEIRSNSLVILNKDRNIDFDMEIFSQMRSGHARYVEWTLDILENMKHELEKINTYKGFVSSTNIFTADYPYINEIVFKLLTPAEWVKLSPFNKVKCYKWICYIILLQMLDKCNEILQTLNNVRMTMDEEHYYIFIDLKSRLNVIKYWAYNLLDNSIKQHFNRKRIIVSEEIITGFDTEFKAENWGVNRLISAQASSTSYIKIKIPIAKEFVFEGVDTLLAQTYIKSPPRFLNAEQLRLWVNDLIIRNREYTFGDHDKIMKRAAQYLCLRRGSFENIIIENNCYTFVTPKAAISNIFINSSSRNLELNMESLLYLINKNISSPNEFIFNLLNKAKISGKGKLSGEGKYTKPWDSKTFKANVVEEVILSPTKNEILTKKFKSNTEEQEWKNIFANADMTFSKRFYIYGHYNSADLTLINNWKEIVKAEKIDILKKSFCSSIKYMQVGNNKVYFRDTLLLASAAAGTLDAVGKMHGISKVKLDEKWLFQMDKLLAENRKLFIDYAMNDSLITLIHALFMNEFSINQGGKGNPLTLGSLATKYLNNKWLSDGYKGYQVDVLYPLGDAQTTVTPKGINSVGNLARFLPNFIGSFRGGRNECLSYGKDSGTIWYDYDLTSCYSTIMSMLEDLDYDKIKCIIMEQEQEKTEKEKAESNTQSAHEKARNFALEIQKFKESFSNEIFYGEETEEAENIKFKSIMAEKNSSELNPLNINSSQDLEKEKSPILNIIEELNLTRAGKKSSDFIEEEEEQDLTESTDLKEMSRISPAVLSLAGNPDYENSTIITNNTDLTKLDFMKSYSAVKVQFKFPEMVKFPPIPVALDDNITIYPLEGKSLITGLEYLSASNILNLALNKLAVNAQDLIHLKSNFYIKIIDGTYIPFSANYPPFYNVIKELQANRRKHPKKSALERIYKDLGNMLYGKTVSGIGNKRVYNSRHQLILPTKGGTLSNPIIGGWITAFVRSLLAEILFIISELGGKVCSVTTDGFVTDIENLEQKIIDYNNKNNITNSFLQKYRDIRYQLSSNPDALEIKTKVRGLIQWKTRNQLSVDHTDPALENFNVPIAAMTGYQKSKNIFENIEIVENVLSKGNKILYLNKSLTGALDAFLRNSDVSMIASLRKFRTIFDSRRFIIPAVGDETMNFSRPFVNIEEAYVHRNLMSGFVSSVYSSAYTHKLIYSSKTVQEELIKVILRSICEYLKWNVNTIQKRDIALFFIELFNIGKVRDRKFLENKAIYIFNIINDILANKGKIITKFPLSEITRQITTKLLELLNNNSSWLGSNNFKAFFTERFKEHIILKDLSLVLYKEPMTLSIIPFVSKEDKFIELLEKYLEFAKFINSSKYNFTYIHPNISKFLISALVSPPSPVIPSPSPPPVLSVVLAPVILPPRIFDMFGDSYTLNTRTGNVLVEDNSPPAIIYLPGPAFRF